MQRKADQYGESDINQHNRGSGHKAVKVRHGAHHKTEDQNEIIACLIGHLYIPDSGNKRTSDPQRAYGKDGRDKSDILMPHKKKQASRYKNKHGKSQGAQEWNKSFLFKNAGVRIEIRMIGRRHNSGRLESG